VNFFIKYDLLNRNNKISEKVRLKFFKNERSGNLEKRVAKKEGNFVAFLN